jgi:hypothetical protein
VEEWGRSAGVDLRETALPAIEVETRKAISKARAAELLKASGADFELRLLLSQHEALTYGTHLAGTMTRGEAVADRGQFLIGLSAQFKGLDEDLMRLLRSNYGRAAVSGKQSAK